MLLRISAVWPLPGLGLLALPEGPTPYLANLALHTALAISVAIPQDTIYAGIATVEEITRGDETVRGLLLQLPDGLPPLPAGTEIWQAEAPPDAYAELK